MSNAEYNWIELTREQVWDAVNRLLDDLYEDCPDRSELEWRAEFLGTHHERNLLKNEIIPRIRGCLDLDWLDANGISYGVKSSAAQFFYEYRIRILVSNDLQKAAWTAWRASEYEPYDEQPDE